MPTETASHLARPVRRDPERVTISPNLATRIADKLTASYTPGLVQYRSSLYDAIERHTKHIVNACRLHCIHSAPRVVEMSLRALGNLAERFDEYAMHSFLPVYDKRQIITDILCLANEGALWDRVKQQLIIPIPAITMTDGVYTIDVGPLNLHIGRMDWSSCLVYPTTKAPRARYYKYFHPHVTIDGEPCIGNARPLVKKLLAASELYVAAHTVINTLKNYNELSCYCSIPDWLGKNACCSKCNSEQYRDDTYHCRKCGARVCRKCRYTVVVNGMGVTHCADCLPDCPLCRIQTTRHQQCACGTIGCEKCMIQCAICHKIMCQACAPKCTYCTKPITYCANHAACLTCNTLVCDDCAKHGVCLTCLEKHS